MVQKRGEDDFSPGSRESTESLIPSMSSTRSTRSTSSINSASPEIMANAALVLITVSCSLLGRQIEAQAKAFEEEGRFHRTHVQPASEEEVRTVI